MKLDLERELTFQIDGRVQKGQLRILRVEKELDRDRWACYWSLSFIHPKEAKIFGDDPLDALFQCLDFIGNLIRGCEKDGLRVWWYEPGDGCGLNFSTYPEDPKRGTSPPPPEGPR